MSDRVGYWFAIFFTMLALIVSGWNVYAVTVTTGSDLAICAFCLVFTLGWAAWGAFYAIPLSRRWMKGGR